MDSFGTRLHAALDERGPLCVGIDPHSQLLAHWGLEDDLAGLEKFSRTVVEALGDRVAALKPQSAFFERHGSRGIAVLESVVREARAAGALVILDVKRGDIGSTMAAYAHAYLDPTSPLAVDAVTVSPYLGFGSLSPIIDTAAAHGGGVFVLALTSNPEGPQVQHAITTEGVTVAQTMLDAVADLNEGAVPLGSFGVVVGATIGETAHDISRLNGPILVPGLGTQGGRPEDLRRIFGESAAAILPSYSREVLAHGPSVTGLRDAAGRALEECRAALQPNVNG
ncbi:orotidine 5'-phosphate decarboxylase [Longispora fulva]|uniref:Orotidine 5'-phosphate decarboxylase n=1 Tax=Longispora fulva TaxID=619741 RepID=A0A8J7H0C7_9ACTN|nr:orotidine-5'-phosphate decarboxylase [Longispora fulva]MBG6141826.1 orotidine-5'-phosphate decarboxylase [Longispora fulva]GIG59019.1 orotidine 5'-phosphate decarboxylase [Longispora fulva]